MNVYDMKTPSFRNILKSIPESILENVENFSMCRFSFPFISYSSIIWNSKISQIIR